MGGRSRGTSRVRGRRGESGWWLRSARRARVQASEHGVVRGAGNSINAEGAVALAAALQGNTTLQTLNLSCTWIALTSVRVYFAGMGGRFRGTSRVRGRGGRERLVVMVSAARLVDARVC
jgi:hypothetical protein